MQKDVSESTIELSLCSDERPDHISLTIFELVSARGESSCKAESVNDLRRAGRDLEFSGQLE